MAGSNSGSVDLQSVLNVRRRTLASIGEKGLPRSQPRYTETIYVKREERSKSLLTMDSKVVIFGELHFLSAIFERFTSNIIFYEDDSSDAPPSPPLASAKPIFSTVVEDDDGPPIVSTMRKASLTAQRTPPSPPRAPSSPTRRPKLSAVGRSQTVATMSNDLATKNLEGKHYGCIELPNMSIIEILEIIMRSHLELVNVSSGYDDKDVLHQNFVFSQTRPAAQKSRPAAFPRSTSFAGS